MRNLPTGRSFGALPLAVLTLASLTVFAAGPARSQTVALDFSGGGPATTLVDQIFGWSFTTASSIQVTDLGFFDIGNDGLARSHSLGLWTSGASLLTSAVIPAGTGTTAVVSASGVGSFRFVSIAPLTLGPGTYVVLASYSASDTDRYYNAATSATLAPGLTFGLAYGGGGTGVSFPSGTLASNSFFGPNLRFNAVSTTAPEPGSLALLLPLIAYSLSVQRRRLAGAGRPTI